MRIPGNEWPGTELQDRFDSLDAMDAVIVGDPEQCIRKVKRYRDAGCDQLLCLMQPYAIPADKVMASIDLFGRYVIPAFR